MSENPGLSDEIIKLHEAFCSLKTQPFEAQVRMLQWLTDRIYSDHRKIMREKRFAPGAVVKARSAKRKEVNKT